jgi:hypothetical protein
MTPAARLLAAADLLDKRASEATEGPWGLPQHETECDARDDGWWIYNGRQGAAEYAVTATVPYNPKAAEDARYIATMHPEVGKALAAMLRVLGSVDYPEVRMGVSVHTQKVFDAALALADLLLAGGS